MTGEERNLVPEEGVKKKRQKEEKKQRNTGVKKNMIVRGERYKEKLSKSETCKERKNIVRINRDINERK